MMWGFLAIVIPVLLVCGYFLNRPRTALAEVEEPQIGETWRLIQTSSDPWAEPVDVTIVDRAPSWVRYGFGETATFLSSKTVADFTDIFRKVSP